METARLPVPYAKLVYSPLEHPELSLPRLRRIGYSYTCNIQHLALISAPLTLCYRRNTK